MLCQSCLLTGAAATFLPFGESAGQEKPSEALRKLNVVAVGGHFDDPQTGCGGTLALYADQGHNVVALSITGGPPPTPDMNPQDWDVKNHLNNIKAAAILGIRLVCMNYDGSSSGQNGKPIVYGTGSEVTGERYKEFTEALLGFKPDIVFTHWPIDFHMDHRAASLLTYSAWLTSGKSFPLYYYESETGTQTQNFWPTHYVDITRIYERKHEAWMADTLWSDLWQQGNEIDRWRGREHGCKFAEAFNHHPQSPVLPALP